MTQEDKEIAVERYLKKRQISQRAEPRACYCTGPRVGEPFCPCDMRNVQYVNGKRFKIVEEFDDLGRTVILDAVEII